MRVSHISSCYWSKSYCDLTAIDGFLHLPGHHFSYNNYLLSVLSYASKTSFFFKFFLLYDETAKIHFEHFELDGELLGLVVHVLFVLSRFSFSRAVCRLCSRPYSTPQESTYLHTI